MIEQQNEQLKHMSITDELTGLSNRRSFDEQFSKDFSLAYREKLYFNFAIVDIDHFKLVNDKYGHQIGDKCLQLLAYAFKKAFNRSSDKISGMVVRNLLSTRSQRKKRSSTIFWSCCAIAWKRQVWK